MYSIDSVARELQLPSIVLRTTSATNLLTYHAFVQRQSKGFPPLQGIIIIIIIIIIINSYYFSKNNVFVFSTAN